MPPTRIIIWSRRVIIFIAAILLLRLLCSFGVEHLAPDNDSVYPFASAGKSVLVYKGKTQYKAGRYVFYKLTLDGKEYLATGMIYAAPGDVVTIEDSRIITSYGDVKLAPKEQQLWLTLAGRQLKQDEFLVFNGNPASQRPDGRQVGIIKLEDLLVRILMVLN
ncbi:hypothetical protein ACFL54_02950 [Planctomycetota bacterium]